MISGGREREHWEQIDKVLGTPLIKVTINSRKISAPTPLVQWRPVVLLRIL